MASAGLEDRIGKGISALPEKASRGRQHWNWRLQDKEELARQTQVRESAPAEQHLQSYVVKTEPAFDLPRLPNSH